MTYCLSRLSPRSSIKLLITTRRFVWSLNAARCTGVKRRDGSGSSSGYRTREAHRQQKTLWASFSLLRSNRARDIASKQAFYLLLLTRGAGTRASDVGHRQLSAVP